MRKLSTSEAAKRLEIQRTNLQRAIARERIQAPRLTRVGGVRVRLWSQTDIKRARRMLDKTARRKQGGGRRHADQTN
jgi:excisionase family DNA binding protein